MTQPLKRIMISKVNRIGDALFALPIASVIKQHWPDAQVYFLGQAYTQDLVDHYRDVDVFVDWQALSQKTDADIVDDLAALELDAIIHVYPQKRIAKVAKRAKIPLRIGTSHRLYHWWTCNRLLNIGRSKSPLHETQLDTQHVAGLGFKKDYSLAEITAMRHFKPFQAQSPWLEQLDPNRFNLILHPKTTGEKIEWPLEKFSELIERLPSDRFKLFVTGSAKEGDQVRATMIDPYPDVVDLCGKLSLDELLLFISKADGLIAASTGPVHLAAAFDLPTLGLYAPIKPFHAGRWGPVGKRAEVLVIDKQCDDCRQRLGCDCIAAISVQQVYEVVQRWQQTA